MKTCTSTHSFTPNKDAVTEHHILIRVADPTLNFESQLDAILQAAAETATGRTIHFRRFFLSDAANQFPVLKRALDALPPVPTSVIQQAPLDGTKIALWMYGTDPFEKKFGIPVHNGYAHVWTGSLVCPGEDSRTQMASAFRELARQLHQNGLTVADDTLRTWILVRDVDTNYAGVVEGRKDYFETIGLTPATHFIASTGIEGWAPDWHNLVLMDAYTVGGLKEGQKRYLKASDHLSPTAVYGVTFERGTAVTYGDRRQIYISGTASIDAQGKVMHPGDVAAQTGRMLENITALLSEAGAGLSDIAMAIVYLRDPADYPLVKKVLAEKCPSLPALFVHAPVCRPSWLVEMECIALIPDGDKSYPDF